MEESVRCRANPCAWDLPLRLALAVLAGYRGGFIFPFMFAGQSIGMGIALGLEGILHVSPAAAALACACAINVAVTRTVLATPIVLATLSGRTDVFPTLLVASIVSLYVPGQESIIKAARKRWLRAELDGSAELVDGYTPRIDRNRVVVQKYAPHRQTRRAASPRAASPRAASPRAASPRAASPRACRPVAHLCSVVTRLPACPVTCHGSRSNRTTPSSSLHGGGAFAGIFGELNAKELADKLNEVKVAK